MVSRAVDGTAAARWTVCGASVRGASHVRDGLPNQDALASWTSDAPQVAIVAIADGHGSPRHFRSALGARFAVDESVAVLRELAGAIDAADAATRSRIAAVDLPRRIVDGWTTRTREHLAAHPLTDEELRGVAEREGAPMAADVVADPLLAYGATLLAALVTGRCVVLTQLGDGDILAVDVDGTTTRPLPVDERLVGNLTTSICRPGAESDFRGIAVPRRAGQAAFLLSTDGYANSFKSDADFLQVGADFATMIARDGIATVERQLDAILQDASTVGSGDDITLGILQCVDGSAAATAMAAQGRTAPAPAAERAAAIDPRLAQAEKHVRRMRIISTAALVVALGVVGWTWRDRLPDWLHAGRPSLVDDHPVKPIKAPKDDRGDQPLKPDYAGPVNGGPKGPDGGILAPAAPKIGDLKAKRTGDGVRVTASLAFDAAPEPGCRFEATLWAAKDRKLESGSSPIAASQDTVRAETTLAFPKDAAKAKEMKAKDVRVSAAVACDGRVVAESGRAAVDG